MSTTRNVFDPTTNLTPQERKPNQPLSQNATTGVQSGPTLTQQARDGAQMAFDAVTSGLSNLMPGNLASTGRTTERHFRNNMPHVGGVGDLPGSANESSVALLPDERAERDAQLKSSQSPLGGGFDRSNDLTAAQDTSRVGVVAPLAGSMMQQQHPGATNQGSSAFDDNAMRGITTTSNTLPHHEQATSPSSAILEHPTGHHEDDTQRKGGVTGRVEDSVKHAAAGVTGTHSDTGTRHRDDSTAGTHVESTQKQGGMAARVEETVKDTTAKVTGTHHDTEARRHDESMAGAGRSNVPHPSNINTSATTTTGHDDHTATSSSPTSPSRLDKLKGAFMMKKGHIFHDEEEVRQGENLKTTGMKFPQYEKK